MVEKNKQEENFKEMSKHIFTCYYFIIYLFSYSYLSHNDFKHVLLLWISVWEQSKALLVTKDSERQKWKNDLFTKHSLFFISCSVLLLSRSG